jgi:hypothetical protein
MDTTHTYGKPTFKAADLIRLAHGAFDEQVQGQQH